MLKAKAKLVDQVLRPRPMHFQDKDCRKPRPRVLEAKAKARDFCPVELFSWSRTVLQDLIPAGHR